MAKEQKKDSNEEDNEYIKLGHKMMNNYNKYIADDSDLIPCVLVATGTFSPVHRMHIINMELSKQQIEKSNDKYCVIGGFISPTHDYYVNHKLGDLGIPAIHRLKMLSLALQDNDWIEVSPWHPNQQYMQSINAEVGYIEEMIHLLYDKDDKYKKFVIFYVCGSDLAIKCEFNMGFGRFGVCIVQRESDLMNKYYPINKYAKPPVYLIDIPSKYDDIKNASSTELRLCIQYEKKFNDITFDSVQEYMIQNDILGAGKLKKLLMKPPKNTDEQKVDSKETKSTDSIPSDANDSNVEAK